MKVDGDTVEEGSIIVKHVINTNAKYVTTMLINVKNAINTTT